MLVLKNLNYESKLNILFKKDNYDIHLDNDNDYIIFKLKRSEFILEVNPNIYKR